MWLFYITKMVDLLDKQWDLGKEKSGAQGKICAWLYLCEILSEAEKVYIKVENRKFIGYSAYSKWESSRHILRKTFFKNLSKLLLNSKKIKNKKAIEEYNKYYEFVPKELQGHFDGEIAMLIVNADFRGKGYGKYLLQKCFDGAKKQHIKTLQILTDESCNYKIYEKMGCKKVYELTIPIGEPGRIREENYIYEKIL